MKKTTKEQENVMTIEEITQLYVIYENQLKSTKKDAEKFKELILDYAREHETDFDGKCLILPNNVRVELREKLGVGFDEESIDVKWIEDACDCGFEDVIKISFDAKKLQSKMDKIDSKQDRLLSRIGVELITTIVPAVCVRS
jgi:hypothetical protein